MKRLMIELPEETLEALNELAGIVEPDDKGENQLASLLKKSVRNYEWIAYQQLHGKTVTALSQDAVRPLGAGEFEEEYDYVERLFPDERKAKVRAYFGKAE